MDPNSAHQLWSRWTATVRPTTTAPSYATVTANCARFYRKAFGSSTELQVTASADHWTIDCRTEGHPAHDPTYQTYMTQQLRTFLQHGFGREATITFSVTIEAGSRQDGKPADQLILGPSPVVLVNTLLKEE